MEDNSFIPFDVDASTVRPNRANKTKKQVIKNGNARSNGRYVVQNEHESSGNIRCTPVYTNGRVSAIQVKCACGCDTTIQLEYGD